MIGRTLGHHRIVEQIGAGGMGEVYRAHDDHLQRDVALKVLRAGAVADEADRRRFRSEALALSRLNHPNIETVHEFDTKDGLDFLVMEYVDGETLSDVLSKGPMSEKDLLRLGAQLADGLAAAHEQGVVHLDLKPGNLRVTRDGRLKILDFGLARLLAPQASAMKATTKSIAENQEIAGTLPYMAPEQIRGERLDHRTDIWSAGVVLYEMATATRPFEGSMVNLALDIQTGRPTPPSRVRPGMLPGLEPIILKCLEKDPDLRYQSARDLLADFRRLGATGVLGEVTPPSRVRASTQERLPPAEAKPGRARVMAWALGAVLVVAAGTAAIVWYERTRQQPAVPGTSKTEISALAVLPLANLSGDPGQEYFVEGMQEALITELSKISALRVISRTSTLRYKGTDRLLPQIAKELGVDAVMEGSVLKSGSRLRVTAQLIQVNPERHLWADNFDRDVTDILYLTSDVAQTVARQIKVVLTPAEEANLARARPVNSQAYELYVLGRHYWSERTAEGHQRAIESFRKALSADAQYAPAYAALADTYMLLGEQGMRPQKEARSEADAAIRKALELDPDLAEAHASLGQWRFYYDWNWAGAEQAFKRAIELNAGYAVGHQLYGRSLGFLGRYDDALAELERARELDPLSIVANSYLGQLYLFQRQYDRAAQHFERARQLNPNHALVRHNLGELYLAEGRFAEGVTEFEKSIGTSDQPSAHYLAMLGCAYARANRREDAIKTLRGLTRRSEKGLVSAFDMASLYTALGDKERAIGWLERGYEQRDYWLAQLKGWPWFDPLVADPRFQNLLRRMNWPRQQ